MAAEKGHCANCAPFYHYPLSIAVLKIKNKYKSSKFWENGEIEFWTPSSPALQPPPINFLHDHLFSSKINSF